MPSGQAKDQALSELLGDETTGSLSELIQNGTLQRGDLLFFDTSLAQTGEINHVGIYDGNGKMISATIKDGVIEQDLLTVWGGYWIKSGTYTDPKTDEKKAYGTFKFARRFKVPPCPKLRSVTVNVKGPGKVTSSPEGISCPGTCTFEFATDSTVVLKATPDEKAEFIEWSGDCDGTDGCDL